MLIPFSHKLETRIAIRAAALGMTPCSYIRKCVESELGKARLGTLTAGKDTPALNGVKKDFGCGAGYRWVGPNEILLETDEIYYHGSWVKTSSVGCIADSSRTFRRKV